MTCSVCGADAPEGAQFCPNCGSPLGTTLPTEERRVVTVLFADLVDSTGLARRLDPERAREVLGRFYDATSEELYALRGHPEKFIGDAVMAVFGVPQTHEDDAVRAVRAGLAIRGRLRRLSQELGLDRPLEVHVGVESGEAATGIGPSSQLLITGPVVNAAARLQGAAGPGEILVGEFARALTETSVSFGQPRTVEAKGFDAELPAFPVEGLTTRSARRTIPFVGRGDELALLRQSFGRVQATGTPMLFTVLGEPGIGKTRLLDEFGAGLDPGVLSLVGRSSLAADSATFAPVVSMVRDAAGIDDGDPPEKARQRLTELLDRGGDDVERGRTLEQLFLLLGLGEDRREESAFIDEVQQGFTGLVDALAAEQPVTLTFEDVHSLRPPMLDLIERVAARRRDRARPAFVLAAARPQLLDERSGWGSSAANHLLLRLESLGDHEAVGLARQAGGARISEDEAAAVAARAGGNPFFIVESTGALIRVHERGEPTSVTILPPTVQAMIAARLDALPATLRDVARRLSVYMYSFDLDEAELVAECGAEGMGELVDAEIVVRDERVSGPPTWRFRNDTLRDVAYASLPKRLRATLHERIAERLEESGHQSWAAEHLEAAAKAAIDIDPTDRRLPERAADALMKAGDRGRRRMESRSAIDYYERALAIGHDGERLREARVLAGAGEAHYWLGEYPAAIGALDRAIVLGGELSDDWTLAHALRFRGDIAINVEADMPRAEELLNDALAAAERLGEPWALARTLLFVGWVPWTRNKPEDADAVWRRALQIAREHGDRWAEVRALTSLSINANNVGDLDEATTLIRQAEQLAEETGDRFSVAVAITQHARLHEERKEFAEALPDLDRAIGIFTGLGARWELADALAERGVAKRELGQLDEAEEDLRRTTRMSEELGERQLASWTWRELAMVSQRRGDHAEAEERFRRADEERARGPQ
jgi:class 3 adenylate cyclase/tetratricopeptide (TPR) repeat protein